MNVFCSIEAAEAAQYIKKDLVVITAGPCWCQRYNQQAGSGEVLLQGVGLGKKAVTGKVRLVKSVTEAKELQEGEILVVPATDKNFVPYLEKAGGLLVEEGGLTSHAALVALHMGLPAIVGANGALKLLTTGQTITLDTVRGLVYRGKATVL